MRNSEITFYAMRKPAIAFGCGFAFLMAILESAAGQVAEGVSEEPKNPQTAPSAEIAIAEVATRATEVADLIRSFNTQLAADAGMTAIGEALPNTAKLIDLEASLTLELLEQQPTRDSLERQELLWRQRQIVTTTWLSALTERASLLQDVLNRLGELEKTWSATRGAAQIANAPEPIIQQIDETLAAIAAAVAPIHAQRSTVLDLQARVAKEVARCGKALADVVRFHQQAVAGIFVRDGQPIWSAEFWARVRTALPDRIHKLSTAYRADVVGYVRDPRGMMLHLALLSILALIFRAARQKVERSMTAGEPVSSSLSEVFRFRARPSLCVCITSPHGFTTK